MAARAPMDGSVVVSFCGEIVFAISAKEKIDVCETENAETAQEAQRQQEDGTDETADHSREVVIGLD